VILTNSQLESNGIVIHDAIPMTRHPITGVSAGWNSLGYDFRMSNEWAIAYTENKESVAAGPKDNTIIQIDDFKMDKVLLKPGEHVISRLLETISMPAWVKAYPQQKTTWTRIGIQALCGPFDPGYKGAITISIVNLGPIPVLLYAGDGIAHYVFWGFEDEVQQYNGDYQHSTAIFAGGTHVLAS